MAKPASLSVGLRLLLASQGMAPLAVKLSLVQQLGPKRAALLAPHLPAEQLRLLRRRLYRRAWRLTQLARLLKRWTEAGLVQRRQQDGLPRYYASTDPQLAPLVTLMQQDSALVRTLRETLEKLDGIEVALVFGSVARGQATANSDVDVLILGTASELKANAALRPAGRQLGRKVHATACTIEAFKKQVIDRESFAQEVVQSPRIPLIGHFDAAIFSAPGQ